MQYFTNENRIWQHRPGACLLDPCRFYSMWFHMLCEGIIFMNMECHVRFCRQAAQNQFHFLVSSSYFLYLLKYVLAEFCFRWKIIVWFVILIQYCLCVNRSVYYEVGSKCFNTKFFLNGFCIWWLFCAVPLKVFLLWFDLASAINYRFQILKYFILNTLKLCFRCGFNFRSFCLPFST